MKFHEPICVGQLHTKLSDILLSHCFVLQVFGLSHLPLEITHFKFELYIYDVGIVMLRSTNHKHHFIESIIKIHNIHQLIYEYIDILRIVGGIIIIIFGIHFTQIIQIPFLNNDTRIHLQNYRPGLIGSYVIGLSFAFGWTPCIGPQLGAILALAASENSVLSGTSLLVVYAIGLGVPFLISAIFISRSLKFMKKIKNHMLIIEKAMGVLLLIVGVLLLTGGFSKVSFFLLELMPFLGNIG